jgi:hypothetical protein
MTEYYGEKLKQGLKYQDFVFDQFYKIGIPLISYSSKEYQIKFGENKAGIEIKYDTKFSETGNFYIETFEKSRRENSDWIKSGIFRNDNTWLYVIGDFNEIYVFSKIQLIHIYNNVDNDSYKKIRIINQISEGTSKGFLLPVNFKNGIFILKKIIVDKND